MRKYCLRSWLWKEQVLTLPVSVTVRVIWTVLLFEIVKVCSFCCIVRSWLVPSFFAVNVFLAQSYNWKCQYFDSVLGHYLQVNMFVLAAKHISANICTHFTWWAELCCGICFDLCSMHCQFICWIYWSTWCTWTNLWFYVADSLIGSTIFLFLSFLLRKEGTKIGCIRTFLIVCSSYIIISAQTICSRFVHR